MISCNAVGIDFGTTECCAAVIRKNGPELVVLDPSTRLRTMPSFIAYDEINPKCGQIVINRMWYKAQHTVYDPGRKISLSRTVLDINIFDSTQNEKILIYRNEFVKMAKPLIYKIKNIIKSALHSGRHSIIQIDTILYVGGGSRMPEIKYLLQNIFPSAEHCCAENPDEVVAIGAAYYANYFFT